MVKVVKLKRTIRKKHIKKKRKEEKLENTYYKLYTLDEGRKKENSTKWKKKRNDMLK